MATHSSILAWRIPWMEEPGLCLFFHPGYVALCESKNPHRHTCVFPTVWKLLLHDSLPRRGLSPQIFCHCFCLLYFVLPPFEKIGLPFWVPGVLHQRSEVVLWYLLSIQMIFWEAVIKTISKKKKCKKAKWLSEEALQIAVKRREAKSKGEKERHKHLYIRIT